MKKFKKLPDVNFKTDAENDKEFVAYLDQLGFTLRGQMSLINQKAPYLFVDICTKTVTTSFDYETYLHHPGFEFDPYEFGAEEQEFDYWKVSCSSALFDTFQEAQEYAKEWALNDDYSDELTVFGIVQTPIAKVTKEVQVKVEHI